MLTWVATRAQLRFGYDAIKLIPFLVTKLEADLADKNSRGDTPLHLLALALQGGVGSSLLCGHECGEMEKWCTTVADCIE